MLPFEDQEFDVDLNVVARDQFLISLGVDGPRPGFSGKPTEAIAAQDAIDTGG